MTHTYGSLFSGVGGFDMGFDQAGWDCKFQVEWDPHCRRILDRHWPDVPKWSDVSTVNGADLPPVDCIIWGSPCQDMSVAGKRAGLDGERSGLFYQGIRIIKEMRDATNGMFPRWSVWENVAGALSSNRGADFGNILDKMAESGALDIQWSLLDAQFFGVPQRRRRVFVVACYDSATVARCPDPLLPVSESLPRDFAAGKQKRQSVTGETATGFGSGSGPWWNGTDLADCLTGTSNEQRMPDKNKLQMVVEGFTPSSFAQYAEGVGTLRSNGGDLGGGSETLLIDAQRVGDVRVYTEPVQTMGARMGTGGNTVPMIAYTKSRRAQTVDDCETWVEGAVNPTFNSFDVGDTRTTTAIIGFSHTQGLDAQPSEVHWPTLRMNGSGHAVAIPIHDQATRYAGKRGDNQDGKGNGLGIGRDGEPMNTLTQADRHAVAFDGYNQTVSDISQTIRADKSDGDHVGMVFDSPTMVVRRLTPTECMRLMGWGDEHCKWNPDGTIQADSHQYRQAGNGVATPVAKWIAQHLKQVDG